MEHSPARLSDIDSKHRGTKPVRTFAKNRAILGAAFGREREQEWAEKRPVGITP